MPNKKYFFDFLPLKIFTGHNIENSSHSIRFAFRVHTETFNFEHYSLPNIKSVKFVMCKENLLKSKGIAP